MTGTVKFHRVLKTKPEKVYKAFIDPDAMSKWLPPYGFTCRVTNFTTGNGHSFGGRFIELVPNTFIKYTDKFDDPNLIGEMEVTVSLAKVSCGTDVSITQSGIPSIIPTEMCYLGWQESLEQLAKLVEPDIPN